MAGTVGVLSLGIQVCNGITKYYEAWRDYDSDIQSLRACVEQLSQEFNIVRQTVSSDDVRHRPAALQIETIVKNCEDGIQALSKRLGKLAATKPRRAMPTPSSGDGAAVVWLEDARKHFLYPFRRGTIGKLRDEVLDLKSRLEPALMLLNIDIAGDTAGEVRSLRNEQQRWRQEAENRRILQWLSPLNFQAHQKDLLSNLHPGSVNETLATPEFVDWTKAAPGTPPGLWCLGKMGSGKSITSAAVVEHLNYFRNDDDNIAVLAMYCDWQDSHAQTVDSLLGSLLKQCAESFEDMPGLVKSLYEEHRFGKLALKASDSLKTLQALAPSFRRVYIVVDGMDELSYEQGNVPGNLRMASIEGALESLLLHVSTPHKADIKVLATSRFLPQNTSTPLWAKIRISVAEVHLQSYIRHALEEDNWMSPWENQSLASEVRADSELMETIVDSCATRANGIFLLSKLSLAHLKRQLNMRQFRTALASLSDTFDEVIQTCVHRILNQSPARRNLAVRTLLWISHACRPMTIQEIQEALVIEIGDDESNPDGRYDVELLVASCAGLVNVDQESQTLRFLSFGIQQYLQRNGSVFAEDPHYMILETCISFFRFKDFVECSNDGWARFRDIDASLGPNLDLDPAIEDKREKKTQSLLQKYPFLAYAARYWPQHYNMASDSRARDLSAKLLSNYEMAGFLYMMYYATQFESLGALATFVTGLHLSCLLGLDCTETLLDMATSTEQQENDRGKRQTDSYGRTPLWFAAACGHLDVVNLLLKNGQDPSGRGEGPEHGYSCFKWWYPAWARDEYFSQAIDVAAEGGYFEIVSQLIAAGVNLSHYEGIYSIHVSGIYGGALEAAVFKGHEKTVDVLLAASPTIRGSNIQAAVYGGNAKILTKLLDALPEKRPGRGTMFQSSSSHSTAPKDMAQSLKSELGFPLYAAALAGRLEIARVLLDRGADVNAETMGFHCTALAAASAYGRLDMVKLLIGRGAKVNMTLPLKQRLNLIASHSIFRKEDTSKAYRHGSALQAASFAGYLDVVRLLCDTEADLDFSDGRFGPAIQAATIAGELEIVRFLVERGAKLNTVAGAYGTCLQAAAFHGHIEILGLLIQAGAEVNLGGGLLGYPVIAAAAGRNVEAIELLIDAGAQINSTTAYVGSSLTAAISTEDANIHLSSSKTPVPQKPSLGHELADFVKLTENPKSFFPAQRRNHGPSSIFGEYIHVVSREIFVGPTKDTKTYMSAEVEHGRMDLRSQIIACVKSLLSHGADPNNCTGGGVSPLQAALRSKNLLATEALVAAGADIPATLALSEVLRPEETSRNINFDPSHPMETYFAPEEAEEVRNGGLALCRLFLNQGADPNAMSPSDGLTPLHISSETKTIALLLEWGAAVDGKSADGQTPLLHAVMAKHNEKVKLLLSAGADVNCRFKHGFTPLHYAIDKSQTGILDTLLKAGADVTLKDEQGNTPLHVAVRGTYQYSGPHIHEMTAMLLEAGADPNSRNIKEMTPLSLADHQDLHLIMMLLEAGVLSPREQEVAFVKAVSRVDVRVGHLDVAQWLIDRGYDINSGEDVYQNGPRWYHNSSIEYLKKENQGQPAASGRRCNALLSLAANGPDNPERLAFLLRNGVDLERHGQKALELAIERQNLTLARGLEDAGVQLEDWDEDEDEEMIGDT